MDFRCWGWKRLGTTDTRSLWKDNSQDILFCKIKSPFPAWMNVNQSCNMLLSLGVVLTFKCNMDPFVSSGQPSHWECSFRAVFFLLEWSYDLDLWNCFQYTCPWIDITQPTCWRWLSMMLDGEEQKHYQEQREETEMSSPWIYELSLVPTKAMVILLLTELGVLCPAAVLL